MTEALADALATLPAVETSKLLQGSTAGKVASASAKASIIIGAVYAIVEIFI